MLFYNSSKMLTEACGSEECKKDNAKVSIDASKINEILSKTAGMDHTFSGKVTLESVRIHANEEGTEFYIEQSELEKLMESTESTDVVATINSIVEFYNARAINMKDKLSVVVEFTEDNIKTLVEDANRGSNIAKVTLGKIGDTLEKIDASGVRIIRGGNVCRECL